MEKMASEIKVKEAFKNALENGGSVSRAMRDAGFSPATSKNPQKLTKTKAWQALTQKYLPDKHLAEKHREFLDSKRIIRTIKKGDIETEISETDRNAVQALDMAYKLKRRYGEEGIGDKTLIINISGETADRYKMLPEKKNDTN